MAKVTKVSHPPKPLAQRSKVAAYARVSMDSKELLHSLSAQVSYYNNLIQSNPSWEFAGIYVDRGISGTQIKKRDEFQRMLEDCDAGKINVILTKSVSRFARNTVDLLSTVRHLKEIGVEVRFEKESINTLSADGELMLTLVASVAQEESRSISENVRWRIQKSLERGIDPMSPRSVLGYTHDGEKYVIKQDEAEIIRYMFQRVLDGLQTPAIAQELNERGWHSRAGRLFSPETVLKHLHNEIYAGDLLRQKSYVADPITHKRVLNHGERPKYYFEDCHEPIVDKEVFKKVQELLKRQPVDSPFLGRLICGCCGNAYVRTYSRSSGKKYLYWTCGARGQGRYGCENNRVKEERLKRVCAQMLGMPEFDAEAFCKRVKQVTVQPGSGDLLFEFKSCTHRTWRNVFGKPNPDDPVISKCFDGLVQCKHCGSDFNRFVQKKKYGYWYCKGGAGLKCFAEKIPDHVLRAVTASMLGQDRLDDSTVKDNIEKIYVTEKGNLEYHFRDGKVETWQKL